MAPLPLVFFMRKEHWALILAAALAACGKSDPPVAPPHLAAPDKAFSSAGGNSLVPPAAEVKASSGPVEFTLLLHKTRIKSDERFWFQLRVRNIGDRKILMTDQIFHDPDQLNDNFRMRYGIFIEATGPGWVALEEAFHPERGPPPIQNGISGMLEIAGPKEQAMVDGWRKQGLSDYDVNLKLFEFNIKKERQARPKPDLPVIRLMPGEIAETKSSYYYSTYDRLIKKRPPPRPIGEFSRLELFDIEEPGKYKIRAVYNYFKTKKDEELDKKYGIPRHSEDVLVRTPWVQVEVLP